MIPGAITPGPAVPHLRILHLLLRKALPVRQAQKSPQAQKIQPLKVQTLKVPDPPVLHPTAPDQYLLTGVPQTHSRNLPGQPSRLPGSPRLPPERPSHPLTSKKAPRFPAGSTSSCGRTESGLPWITGPKESWGQHPESGFSAQTQPRISRKGSP